MAIRKEIIDLMSIGCNAIGQSFRGLKICELGNQYVKDHPKFKTAKQYLTTLGVDHISFDLNGEDGAMKIDLSIPIVQWNNYFEMVTNYGTSEHVSNQYMVFKNIHDLVRKGGVMVHASPEAGYWCHHGKVNYEKWFFDKLAEKNNYEVIVGKSIKKLDRPLPKDLYFLCAVMIKKSNKEFISIEDFNDINGIRKTER